MGFTKSMDDLKIHQKLSDEPNIDDGLSAEELKFKFDKPVTDLQKSFNKLIDELENTQASKYIGAEPLDEYDDTENNIQAKLLKIRAEIQNITLGQIPDGTITEEKMNTEYNNSLAKRNAELQINLNAEMVGGKTLEELIKSIINGVSVTGTFTSTNDKDVTINCGFKPKLVLFVPSVYKNTGITLGIIINDKGCCYNDYSDGTPRFDVTLTSNGCSFSVDKLYSIHTYSYIAFKGEIE